jgi:flagellar motor component MotA
MKKNIVKLRILGMVTFLLYLLLVMVSPSKVTYTLIQIQQLLIITSIASFAIIMAMQVYRIYIKTYAKEEEEE